MQQTNCFWVPTIFITLIISTSLRRLLNILKLYLTYTSYFIVTKFCYMHLPQELETDEVMKQIKYIQMVCFGRYFMILEFQHQRLGHCYLNLLVLLTFFQEYTAQAVMKGRIYYTNYSAVQSRHVVRVGRTLNLIIEHGLGGSINKCGIKLTVICQNLLTQFI